MRPVNLLPGDLPGERRRRPSLPLLAAGVAPVLVAGLVHVGWSAQQAQVRDRTDELAIVQAQVDRLQPAAGSPASRLADVRLSHLAELRDALGKQVAWDATLDAIARVLPSDVWLTQLTLQSPEPVAATASGSAAQPGQGLSITGAGRTQASVAHALARLALVPGLSDVTLGSTAAATSGTKPFVQFQLSATIGAS